MDKIEIITPETKDELEQPHNRAAPSKMLKEISLLSTIYQWNPMGIRVVLNLPIIGDDKSCLFYISASPYIPHIANDYMAFTLEDCFKIYGTRCAVFHERSDSTPYLTISEAVNIVQHSPPPFISDLARSNRYWKGSLKYRLRAVASFLNQGYIQAVPFYGIRRKRMLGNPFSTRQSFVRPDESSYLGAQANSYVMADASMSRHMEIEVDYRHITPSMDMLADLSSLIDYNTAPGVTAEFAKPPATPHDETLIGVQLRGELPPNGTTNQMAFELEIAAGENFEVSGESVYFYPASRFDTEIWRQYYYSGNVNFTRLPEVYLTPDFDLSATLPRNRWDGRTSTIGERMTYTP
nr:MAG: putative capsid protein [Polycipiviridae sp.]